MSSGSLLAARHPPSSTVVRGRPQLLVANPLASLVLSRRVAERLGVLRWNGELGRKARRCMCRAGRRTAMVRGRTKEHYWGVVLDAPDVTALGRFYAELLGWDVYKDEPGEFGLAAPSGNSYLAIQPQ